MTLDGGDLTHHSRQQFSIFGNESEIGRTQICTLMLRFVLFTQLQTAIYAENINLKLSKN
jgi:hypothetical protein